MNSSFLLVNLLFWNIINSNPSIKLISFVFNLFLHILLTVMYKKEFVGLWDVISLNIHRMMFIILLLWLEGMRDRCWHYLDSLSGVQIFFFIMHNLDWLIYLYVMLPICLPAKLVGFILGQACHFPFSFSGCRPLLPLFICLLFLGRT